MFCIIYLLAGKKISYRRIFFQKCVFRMEKLLHDGYPDTERVKQDRSPDPASGRPAAVQISELHSGPHPAAFHRLWQKSFAVHITEVKSLQEPPDLLHDSLQMLSACQYRCRSVRRDALRLRNSSMSVHKEHGAAALPSPPALYCCQ